jgi:hypothetical protein
LVILKVKIFKVWSKVLLEKRTATHILFSARLLRGHWVYSKKLSRNRIVPVTSLRAFAAFFFSLSSISLKSSRFTFSVGLTGLVRSSSSAGEYIFFRFRGIIIFIISIVERKKLFVALVRYPSLVIHKY